MKRVHNARHMAEAHFVRGFLESHGIDALVRGDFLTGGWGELPVDVCTVWIIDDTRFAEADRLLQDLLKGAMARIHAPRLRAANSSNASTAATPQAAQMT